MKNAPIQTNLHFIYASGKKLNISANKTVIIARENIILSILNKINKDTDHCCVTHEPDANKTEENTREIKGKKPIEIINPKEKILDLRNDQIPDLVFDD